MRLLKAVLEDYRGFDRLEISFEPDVTVLVGINGSGKTTVLDAIAAVFRKLVFSSQSGWQPWHGAVPTRHDIRIGAESARVATEWSGSVLDSRLLVSSNDRPTGMMPPFSGDWPILAYYAVDRHADDDTSRPSPAGDWQQLAAWKGSLDSRTTFSSFFHWFREREDLENEERRDDPDHRDPQLEAVRTALERLLPGYGNPRIRRPRFDGSDVSDVPSFAIEKHGELVLFSQLSEGERAMAALAADIARRASIAVETAKDPLAASGLVMIDEIELHLHPKWQAEVIEALTRTFVNLQFILTSHSPIVVGHAPSKSLRLLSDFRLVSAPAPTGGRDPNSLLREVFEAPVRPQGIRERLDQVANLIDANRIDDARASVDALGQELGDQDPDVVRLRTLVDFLMAD